LPGFTFKVNIQYLLVVFHPSATVIFKYFEGIVDGNDRLFSIVNRVISLLECSYFLGGLFDRLLVVCSSQIAFVIRRCTYTFPTQT